jgi:hypothetical protein
MPRKVNERGWFAPFFFPNKFGSRLRTASKAGIPAGLLAATEYLRASNWAAACTEHRSMAATKSRTLPCAWHDISRYILTLQDLPRQRQVLGFQRG